MRIAARVLLPLIAVAALVAAAPASADPKLDVPTAKLKAALHCQKQVSHPHGEPVLLVTGTGVPGGRAWPLAQPVLLASGHPSCYLDFPENTTGDMQVAAEYIVFGVRRLAARSHRKIAIYGISQGGVLPRIALRYWPKIRKSVSDAVLLAGTQHGTTVSLQSCSLGCPAAVWQQAAGSNLLTALNKGDETPGRVSYTTVRTLNDAVVQPVAGPHPTSALAGAVNFTVQSVCPARQIDHIGLAADSIAFAALLDAMGHRGPARASRLPLSVCTYPFAGRTDPVFARAEIGALYGVALQSILTAPKLNAEPALKSFVKPR